MITEIKNNMSKIQALCKSHNVISFSLFGSAARNEMKDNSDFDFLVRFSTDVQLLDYADNYFDLLFQLEELFQRKVDLVSEKSLKNPILIQEINNSKISLYEA
jgi:predicted nucleotidyltransferase